MVRELVWEMPIEAPRATQGVVGELVTEGHVGAGEPVSAESRKEAEEEAEEAKEEAAEAAKERAEELG